MLREAFYRKMIDAYDLHAQFEMIYGDVELVVATLKKSLEYGEKLKKIAKSSEDAATADAVIQTNSLLLATIEGKKSIAEFKKEIREIERKYPPYFQRGRRDIGTSKDNVNAMIHRVEYMINRYDVRYPNYDRHRCNDA